jgi:hypothetical protein
MSTVYEAIGAIIRELDGVGKNQRNKEQGYAFRGIDDVLKALHPLLGQHGVFIAPDVIERQYEERVSAKGTVGHCAHLHVRFRVYGPEGDSIQISTWGEGLDYGDKATNKAMTAAFKYALFELFAVSDPADDGDHESPEPTVATVRRPPPVPHDRRTGEVKNATSKQIGLLKSICKENQLTPAAAKAIVDDVVGRETLGWEDLTSAEASMVIDALKPPTTSSPDEDPF